MTKQTLVVKMFASTHTASGYVDTRRRFRQEDLRSLRSIYGVTRVTVHDFTISLTFGKAFDFNTLMAKSLKKILEMLNTTVDDADIRVADYYSGKDNEKRLRDVLDLVKRESTPQNPVADFAATLDDIKVGVELMRVSYERFNVVDVFEVASLPADVSLSTTSSRFIRCVRDNYPWPSERSLGDMGVLPYNAENNAWNKTYVTIVNTPENRRKLVEWLLERGAGGVAVKIMNQYLDEFVQFGTASCSCCVMVDLKPAL